MRGHHGKQAIRNQIQPNIPHHGRPIPNALVLPKQPAEINPLGLGLIRSLKVLGLQRENPHPLLQDLEVALNQQILVAHLLE